MTNEFIPLCLPVLEEEEIQEVVECLRSGWITTGPRVKQFEEMFCKRLGTKHAIAVCSATAGWHIVAQALGIGPGTEVIVPAITWVSVPNIVELLGAKTIFADVDPTTLQVDPQEIARLISPQTRAVMPVHYTGAPVDLDAIRSILAGKNIALVEDAAHALGTTYKGVEVGANSEIAIFSFHPIKNITTGEGGMIVLNDDALAERLRLLRFHGITKDAWKRYNRGGSPQYEVIEPGYKYNMMDIQAALGIRQLPKLERFNQRRAELAQRYNKLLEAIPEVNPLGRVNYPHQHAWHLYIARINTEALKINRDEVIAELNQEKIGAALHFPALHVQPYYKNKYGYKTEDLPHAGTAGEQILSLPLHPGLTETDQDRIIEALKTIIQRNLRNVG